MRNPFQSIFLLAVSLLLLAGCSKKETFFFSDGAGSFGPNQKVQKEDNLRNSLIIHHKLTDLDRPNKTDSPVLTATTATATNPELLPWSKKNPARGFNASLPAKKVEVRTYSPVVKNKARQNQAIKKYLEDPVANKKVDGVALAGFIFSIVALVSFIAGSWLLAILLGIIGSILGTIGIINIMKNPDISSGKAYAWIGIILGFLPALAFIAFLVSYAGGW